MKIVVFLIGRFFFLCLFFAGIATAVTFVGLIASGPDGYAEKQVKDDTDFYNNFVLNIYGVSNTNDTKVAYEKMVAAVDFMDNQSHIKDFLTTTTDEIILSWHKNLIDIRDKLKLVALSGKYDFIMQKTYLDGVKSQLTHTEHSIMYGDVLKVTYPSSLVIFDFMQSPQLPKDQAYKDYKMKCLKILGIFAIIDCILFPIVRRFLQIEDREQQNDKPEPTPNHPVKPVNINIGEGI